MKVLVCDDDLIVLKVVQVVMLEKGVDAVYVKDGRKAIQLLHEDTFDLIITDIHMPYYNGDEILKLVREEQNRNTPIIMISSDVEEEVMALALKQGVAEFIKKPVDADLLRTRLKKYLP